jgi:hypothetical protein
MSPLLEEIIDVFPPKPLSISIFSDPTGRWNSYPHAAQFMAECEGKSWDELSIPFLNFHEDSLRLLSPAAFVAIIPAHLAALLDTKSNYNLIMITSLTVHLQRRSRWVDVFDARFDLIDEMQRKVIIKVLQHPVDEGYDGALDTLHRLMDLPEKDPIRARIPDEPTTPVLPLPPHYAHLEQELLAAFPPQPLLMPDIARWKRGYGGDSVYLGNLALERGFAGKSWSAVSLELIRIHEHALETLKPEGYAALVPAYLAALLHTKREMMDLVYHGLIRRAEEDLLFATITEHLNRAQRQVLVHVFAALNEFCGRPEWPQSKHDVWVAEKIKLAYEGWCSVIDGPPNVKTLSDPVPPPHFQLPYLIQRIREAFPSQIMSSQGFLQSLAPETLSWLMDDDLKGFLDRLDGQSWDTLSPTLIDHYSGQLSSLQRNIPNAFVAVLPAYLEHLAHKDLRPFDVYWALKRDEEEDEAVFLAMTRRFNQPQQRVIMLMLELIVHNSIVPWEYEGEAVTKVLAAWRAVCVHEHETP